MVHAVTHDAGEIAASIVSFARDAAEKRMIMVRGDVSTPIPLPETKVLAVRAGGDRIILVGRSPDAGCADGTADRLADAIRKRTLLIEAGSALFPIDGPVSAIRPNFHTLILESHHIRADGRPSGSVSRMVIFMDEAACGQRGAS